MLHEVKTVQHVEKGDVYRSLHSLKTISSRLHIAIFMHRPAAMTWAECSSFTNSFVDNKLSSKLVKHYINVK